VSSRREGGRGCHRNLLNVVWTEQESGFALTREHSRHSGACSVGLGTGRNRLGLELLGRLGSLT